LDWKIPFVVEGESTVTMSKSAGLAIIDFTAAFDQLRPDAVVIVGDRFETLAVAMASTYLNIPLVHIEGGEVSGSIDESIRHAVTKLSHLHFPANEDARQRIVRLGEHPDSVFNVGATSLDIVAEMCSQDLPQLSTYQEKHGVGAVIDTGQLYLVVSQHPVTTEYEKNVHHITETIEAIKTIHMPTFWIWPNMDAGSDGVSWAIRRFREQQKPDYIHFFTALPLELYAPLLKGSACLVGNSSSGIRESAFMGTPCVNVGTRQQGRQRGRNVVDVGYNRYEIADAISRQVVHGPYEADYLYGDGRSGQRMCEILKDFRFSLQKRITF
jgi:UDP-hydrolysing UDP-N-acetyl-D-glucosamine 2-epimerase